MNPPDEIRFACIGCGALNPPGAEACSGCGHRFAGPDVVPAPRRELVGPPAPREPLPRPLVVPDEYAPPTVPVARPTTFGIGTAMAVIAVIAVCLGAFASDPMLGTFATIGLVPAAIRTGLIAERRRTEGRPMGLGEQFPTFIATIGATYVTLLASLIAFAVTCGPVGFIAGNAAMPAGLFLAFGLGLAAAVAVGVWVSRSFLKVGREIQQRERDRELIRWR